MEILDFQHGKNPGTLSVKSGIKPSPQGFFRFTFTPRTPKDLKSEWICYSCMKDITFTAIAQRAARYPVVLRRGQMPPLQAKIKITPIAECSENLGWLLLNTLEVNRVLAHAAARKT
jgi:hypothetical protein